ncbi:MAG: hypothetical protein D6711_14325 [Chloroflexi bacterium]|nr:MAG: hypothetical protein D6711_14325 [Chloroflexota bacterium]
MRRGTIFPILFIIISAAIVGSGLILNNQETKTNEPIQLSVAVSPLAEHWLQQATRAFNNSEVKIDGRVVTIDLTTTIDDTQAWDLWTTTNHPDLWIPAARFSIEVSSGEFSVLSESVAKTPIIWMGYQSRVDALTANGQKRFDWQTVIDSAALESWGAIAPEYSQLDFINIALAPADKDITGLAALISAAADTNSTNNITASQLRGTFRDRLIPVLNALQPYIGSLESYVARPNTVHLAIGAESVWLTNLTSFIRNEPVQFSYPAYTVLLDFPVAIWDDTDQAQLAAAQAFVDWLLEPEQQTIIPSYGLRPAVGAPTLSDSLFTNAQIYGIELNPTLNVVQLQLSSGDIQGLLAWFNRRG